MESAMESREREETEKTDLSPETERDHVSEQKDSILSSLNNEGSQQESESIKSERDKEDKEETGSVEGPPCEREQDEEVLNIGGERYEAEKEKPEAILENELEKKQSGNRENVSEKEEPVASGDQPEAEAPGEPPTSAEKEEEEGPEGVKIEEVERSIEERSASSVVEHEKVEPAPPYTEREPEKIVPPSSTERIESRKVTEPPASLERKTEDTVSKEKKSSPPKTERDGPKTVEPVESSISSESEQPEDGSVDSKDESASILSEMTIDFYYHPGSSPCRSVLLAAKALGLDLNLKHTDLQKGEHLTPEFIELNPQHTIPTLVDDGFPLWESRVIMTYLVSKYGKDDSLYPKDPKKRAVVDQRLYFDVGTLYARYADYYYPVFFGSGSFDSAKLEKIKDAFGFLNTFLKNHDYVAGDTLTVADLAIVATVSTYDVSGFNISAYPNVARWYTRVKANARGYEEANGKNVQIYRTMIEPLMKKK